MTMTSTLASCQEHVELAWQAFINETGQEHWHCECAALDAKKGSL